MNIIVLGCNGYIGKKLCKYINLNFPKINLYGADINNNFLIEGQFIGNLLEKEFTEFIFKDNYYDIVFIATGKIFTESFKEYFEYNVSVTNNILSSLVGKGSKIIVLQSAAQYGKGERNFRIPVNYYGLTKEYQEQLAKYYVVKFNLKIISPILFNVYGDGQSTNFVIPKLLKRVKSAVDSNSKVVRDINKEFYRDFIHIGDVLKILSDIGLKGPVDREYEIGTGKVTKVSDILKLIVDCYNYKGFNLNIVYEDYDYKNTDIIKQVATINDKNYNYKKIEDYIKRKIM
jgi:nucleoside-diphosphate-sugar epimerase